MEAVSNLVVDLISAGLATRDPAAIGMAFFRSLLPFGATAINARGYQSTRDLTASGQVFARFAPDTFMPVYQEERFYTDNPLPFEAQRRSRPFLWSDLSWADPKAKWVRDTMHDCGCPDGIFVPCHGPNNYLGAVSLAFERLPDVAPSHRSAIMLASYFLHEHMKDCATPHAPLKPSLTARERDCLAFVADGLTDPEIAEFVGVSVNTVAFHIKNARLKLGARTRSQAVARFVLTSL